MASSPVQAFAIVGLGKIGGNLARQALAKDFRVVGYTRHAPPADLVEAGMVAVEGLPALRDALTPPRKVLLYIPAGPAVDEVLAQLVESLEPGDVVADGGNSYWGDSIRRQQRLLQHGLGFVDVGTSGGLRGARQGACFMIGGEPADVALLEPVLKALAEAGGYVHAGPPGAGHFVKLVHNGIEFGMLQAIGEGVDLLEHYRAELPVADILRSWRHGSVIRSWLVELIEAAYREQPSGLQTIEPYVEDTGEVNWLIDDALRMEVAIPVIAQSVMQLIASRDERRLWARAIAMMRHGFGGHPYGRNDAIAAERQQGRVGGDGSEGAT